MAEKVSISVNGQSQVPPGFRFHPTEEELLHYYLKKKLSLEEIDLDVIRDVDLNKLEPWDIQEKCKIGSTRQNDWYFFSHKDKKYPTGTRTNRATTVGFWKATGRDKVIHGSGSGGGWRIGMRKTLVFYKGRAPHGQKSDWIMHEYRLDDHDHNSSSSSIHVSSSNLLGGESGQEEGWVVCRIFKKKNLQRSIAPADPTTSSETAATDSRSDAAAASALQMFNSCDQGELDQIIRNYMAAGRNCKDVHKYYSNSRPLTNNTYHHYNSYLQDGRSDFIKLPTLDSPNCSLITATTSFTTHKDEEPNSRPSFNHNPLRYPVESTGLTTNWAALDHLNGQHHYPLPTDTTNLAYSTPSPSDANHDDDDHEVGVPDFPLPPNLIMINNNHPYDHHHHHHHHHQEYNVSNSDEIINLWSFAARNSTTSPSSDGVPPYATC